MRRGDTLDPVSLWPIMWESIRQLLTGGRAEHYLLRRNGQPVSYRDVLQNWQDDETFRSFFISVLAASAFQAFRWETPPITTLNAGRQFEFVLLDVPGLDRPPDAYSFAEQFKQAGPGERVVTFRNLGGDAILVVPCPAGDPGIYVHLASFVRGAPASQVHELWRSVGKAMSSRLGTVPCWLSTAGMGVSWLHVRLDSRPKYYAFAAYREGE